jgi:hypothetical protein
MEASARIEELKRRFPGRAEMFATLDAALAEEVAAVAEAGAASVPQVEAAALLAGKADPRLPDLIRRRGCVVVRGVFPRAQAEEWDQEIAAYLAANDADARSRAARPGRWPDEVAPQMYGIYWSRPQVLARQDPRLAAVRAWLNRLWRFAGHFDPDRDRTYADRLRRRTPGDATLALGPHIDGGTAGRWLDPALRAPYAPVLTGDPAAFDPFDAAHRPDAPEGADANACSVFRTWQGWTALTAQGPGDGTLQVVPIARAIAWVLLRPFAPDVAPGSLCGAEASRALWVTPDWHGPLLRALVPIPRVEPGDTVWWHPDLIHAVEPRHAGTAMSNVMYIPAVPDCPRTRAYLAAQAAAFRAGKSPPDFPPDHLERDFTGRAGPDLLTALGRAQMGMD